MQSNALRGHVREQEPLGPGPRTTKAKDRAVAPVTRSEVAQDTARKFYSGSNTVFVPLLLLAADVGLPAACF